MMLGGEKDRDEYYRLEFMLTPCNYLHTHLGWDADSIPDECIADQQAQIEWMGPINIVAFISHGVFDPRGYGEEAVKLQTNYYKA